MDMKSGLCSGFDDKLNGNLNNLNQLKDIIGSPTSKLKGEMSKLPGKDATGINDIESGIGAITDTAEGSVPSIPDVNEIEDILKECDFLKNSILGGLQNPSGIAGDYLDKAFSAAGDSLDSLLDLLGGLIEAPVAFLINKINDLLIGYGIKAMLKEIDGLLNCLDAACGTDIQDKLDEVDEILEKLNVDDEGNFDSDKLFEEFNIQQDIIDNAKKLSDTLVKETKNSKEELEKVADSIEESIDKVKDINTDTKPGEEIKTAAEAAKEEVIKQTNNLKSFFT